MCVRQTKYKRHGFNLFAVRPFFELSNPPMLLRLLIRPSQRLVVPQARSLIAHGPLQVGGLHPRQCPHRQHTVCPALASRVLVSRSRRGDKQYITRNLSPQMVADEAHAEPSRPAVPLSALVRSYTVYSICRPHRLAAPQCGSESPSPSFSVPSSYYNHFWHFTFSRPLQCGWGAK